MTNEAQQPNLESNTAKRKRENRELGKKVREAQGFEWYALGNWFRQKSDLVLFTDDGFTFGKIKKIGFFGLFFVLDGEKEGKEILKNNISAIMTDRHFDFQKDDFEIDKSLWKEARVAPPGAWKAPKVSKELVEACMEEECNLKLLLQNGVSLEGVPFKQSETAIYVVIHKKKSSPIFIYKHAVLQAAKGEPFVRPKKNED